jgi:hypothetical protein
MNDWIGKTLGKVRIDSLIARGGMAEVYLGTHTTLKRQVAVKILRAQYEDDPDLLERFEREAQVVAKLRHQNIVQVFDFDSINDSPYIVMEYVPGPSLSQYLSVLHKNNLRVELSNINKILTGVAGALQYAHDNGVIHFPHATDHPRRNTAHGLCTGPYGLRAGPLSGCFASHLSWPDRRYTSLYESRTGTR